jgi:hypothetical protein
MDKKAVRDPDTGKVIEWLDNSPDAPEADALQTALNRRLLEWTGKYDARGRAIYERTSTSGHGLKSFGLVRFCIYGRQHALVE